MQVMRDMLHVTKTPDPAPGAINLTATVHMLVKNASCLIYSMWPRSVPPEHVAKFSLGLYSINQLSSAVFSFDQGQGYNLSSCTLATCNATAGNSNGSTYRELANESLQAFVHACMWACVAS